MFKKFATTAVLALCATVGFSLTAQADTSVTVKGTDMMQFSKDSIEVAPGEEVTIKFVSDSAMQHNLVILDKDADVQAFDSAAGAAADNDYIPADQEDEIIAHTELVDGGDSEEITFTAPEEEGDYPFLCTFPGHYAAGMKGTLVVK